MAAPQRCSVGSCRDAGDVTGLVTSLSSGGPVSRRPRWAQRFVRDLEYRAWGLVVELDGRLNHADTERVMRDMARDNAVTVTGRATLRYGWREVAGRPRSGALVRNCVS